MDLRKHLWIANLLSLALMAFFLATGVGSMLSLLFVSEPEAAEGGLTSPQRARPGKGRKTQRVETRTGRDVCANNVFNYKLRPCAGDIELPDDEGEDDEGPGDGVPPYCSGDCALIATMASTDVDWSFAMIKAEGKTLAYRVGDDIAGVGKITRVGWRLVLVDSSSGPDCLLDLYPPAEEAKGATPRSAGSRPAPASSKGRPKRGAVSPELQKQIDEGIEVVSANERNVDRGLVESLIENSSSLMSQARILPYERDGQVQGFKLYGIRRNSLLGKLGLRNGDIVNSIGGTEMTSPDQALMAYTKLRNANNLTVSFTRRGRRQTMDFNIR